MIKKLIVGISLLFAVLMLPSAFTKSEASADVVVLTTDNLLLLNGEINGDSAGKLILKARELDALPAKGFLNKKKEHIYFFLRTPGGLIDAGAQITEVLNGLERKVDTITAFSASMGFQLVQSLGERLILKSGTLMSHHAKGGVEGEFGGAPTQMNSRYMFLLDTIREMDDQTVKRTKGKQTYESYIKSYDHELWKTGLKSVAEGYADKVVTVRCDKSLAGTSSHKITIMGIEINYDLDNCPISQEPMNITIGQMPPGMTHEMGEAIKKQFLQNYEVSMKIPKPLTF